VTETPSTPSKEQVLDQAKRDNVRYVSFQFTDILGVVKNITIPFHQFENAVDHGLWFDGSSIEGFTRIHESDMYLQPDLATFGIIPWARGENTTARVICDVFTPDGEPFDGDPRGILRRQLKRVEEKGWRFNTGPELEFFLLQGDGNKLDSLPHDKAGYFDSTSDEAEDIRKNMVNALEGFGIEVEALHHEVAAGQHEIDFRYADALKTADNAVTLRVALKAVAQRTIVNGHPLYATFMPKPFFGINGSGMHTHQSLADLKTGQNLFYDGTNEYNLSKLARSFIAGLLKHARGRSLVLSPLVNSY
jgi:glutamine synthetase